MVQSGAFVVVFAIDTLALAVMFRFLSGAAMPWRRMWIGSLLGAAALSLLQLLGGFLIGRSSTNPLLATFAVFIGLLLWFRITSIVILVAASWIAVEAADAHESLRKVTPEQLAAEQLERGARCTGHGRAGASARRACRGRLRELGRSDPGEARASTAPNPNSPSSRHPHRPRRARKGVGGLP